MKKFNRNNLSPDEAHAILDDAIRQMLAPDIVSVWEFASSEAVIAGTTNGRMFYIEATDDGAFSVTELDASKFGIHDDGQGKVK